VLQLENSHFHLVCSDQDGSMRSLVLKADKRGMNWLPDTDAERWIPAGKRWGLGFATIADRKYVWRTGRQVHGNSDASTFEYRLDRASSFEDAEERLDLTLTVQRRLVGETVEETFIFTNNGDTYVNLDELGIYSTFYDAYPVIRQGALAYRAHMHIWTGGDLSYIRCIRMNAKGPHLAMLTVEGRVEEYQVENKQSSNQRGIIALTGKRIRIAGGHSYRVKRIFFPYADERYFHHQVTKYSGYPHLAFDRLAAPVGENVRFDVKEQGAMEKLVIGERVYYPQENEAISITLDKVGLIEGKIHFNGKQSVIRWYGIPDVGKLLEKRAAFIVSKQQLRSEGDMRDGAFLPYDQEADRIVKVEDIEGLWGSIPDRNDARERLGMGAFLAAYYRLNPSAKNMEALSCYYRFIKTYIIGEDYRIWDSCFGQSTAKYYGTSESETKDMAFRGFNYFFVCAFLMKMYRLTKDPLYLQDTVGVLAAYFDKFALADLSFGLNPNEVVQALKEERLDQEAERLTRSFVDKAYAFVRMGEQYEPSEVNYEQSTVAGVVMYLLDVYRLTGDRFIREGALKHLALLECFDGCQPDFRMYGVGLRHWDGYWFGKYELWGDTLPHQWSTLSAYAYYRYYQITADRTYYDKALRCLYANLCLFRETGAADYAFIYPHKVNGRPGHLFDPISNDQDWALYFLLECLEDRLLLTDSEESS